MRLAVPSLLAWLLLALSLTQTKLAGLLWVLLCLWSWVLLLRHRTEPLTPSALAAKRWLVACSITLASWFLMSLYWDEPCCHLSADVGSGLRLCLGALAAYGWARYWSPVAAWTRWINQGLAVACASSLVMAFAVDRGDLPSYPIPWSAAAAMLLTLLLPQALNPQNRVRDRQWWLCCCGLGVAGVLLSQSRGTYLVIGWLIYVWGSSSTTVQRRWRPMQFMAGGILVAAAIGLTATLPSDPLRIREGWHDWTAARTEDNQNTSLGARLALYELALDTIAESPWVGVGVRERLRRIHTLGLDLPPQEASKLEHARSQGHVHNAYLHHAMDGGIVALTGFLASIMGLLYAARAWSASQPIAQRQMLGIAFVHASASLSNVNLAHNYYAVMLSLCTTLVVIQALASSASTDTTR